MNNSVRTEYARILHLLWEEWFRLETNPNATQRDFARVASKMREACRVLDREDDGALS